MSKVCELTGVRAQFGNKVSHSQRKTRRRFDINLRNYSIFSETLNEFVKLRLAARTLRSIDHNGGLDNFLTTAKAHNLTEQGQKLRRKIKKAQAAK